MRLKQNLINKREAKLHNLKFSKLNSSAKAKLKIKKLKADISELDNALLILFGVVPSSITNEKGISGSSDAT